jgi:hypothetical protein
MEIPIEEGQHYENSRGDIYTVEYHNEDIVLLYDGHNYRLERENYFEELVDAGKFELYEEEINASEAKILLRDISHIGETTEESMEKNGYTTPVDIDRTSDEKILNECEGLGEAGLENVYEWIENNTGEKKVEI